MLLYALRRPCRRACRPRVLDAAAPRSDRPLPPACPPPYPPRPPAAAPWLRSCAAAFRTAPRSLSSPASASPSPYAVFGLPKRASEADIRARFRELAYEHHPDLNPDDASGHDAMARVVDAYQALLAGTGAGAARDSRVGMSVEKFTIQELMHDEEHTVVDLVVSLDELLEDGGGSGGGSGNNQQMSDTDDGGGGGVGVGDDDDDDANKNHHHTVDASVDGGGATGLARATTFVHASTYDAVADLKRDLHARFADEWGLAGRRLDNERVAIGWELVHASTVLCPNYFLGDYAIKSGDTIHAVIRKDDP